MHLSELKALHVSQLLEMAIGLEIDNANRMRKQELMFAILKKRAKSGEQIFGDGTLEVLPDGFGFLRSPETSYLGEHRRHLHHRHPRSGASTSTPGTRSKARSARRRTASATSRW